MDSKNFKNATKLEKKFSATSRREGQGGKFSSTEKAKVPPVSLLNKIIRPK